MSAKVLFTTVSLTTMLTACAQLPTTNNAQSIEISTYSWITLGAQGKQIARSVTTASQCPQITIDNDTSQMKKRAAQAPEGFEQVLSCETSIAEHVVRVSIEGVKLKLLPKRIERIVVIGDTGCRMKVGDFQNCNNIEGQGKPWPFAKVAEQVARANPDMILHMGDYFYRETPCPLLNKGCAGPSGFKWATWQADFFEPAASALPVAPWLMTRGNHEDCKRAYKGWFYFLDTHDLAEDIWRNCVEASPPYQVDIDGLTLINMDSATLPDAFSIDINPATVDRFTNTYKEINAMLGTKQNAWIFSHRPVWAISSYFDWKRNKNSIALTDPTMQAALKQTNQGGFTDSVKLLLSGHIHNFETLTFSDGRPAQMVVGTSGTRLSPQITNEQLQSSDILQQLNLSVIDFYATSQFAYALFERQPHEAWLIKLIGLDDKVIQSFVLKGKRLERTWE